MGTWYSGRDNQIENYTPDDTANEIYVERNASMSSILERIKEKWGDVDLKDIDIESQYIHTHCLYYDCYDAGDYTNYLVITNNAIDLKLLEV